MAVGVPLLDQASVCPFNLPGLGARLKTKCSKIVVQVNIVSHGSEDPHCIIDLKARRPGRALFRLRRQALFPIEKQIYTICIPGCIIQRASFHSRLANKNLRKRFQ